MWKYDSSWVGICQLKLHFESAKSQNAFRPMTKRETQRLTYIF